MLFSCSEPLLKASYHEFRAFREWILATQQEYESPLPDHSIAKSLLKRFSNVFPKEIPFRLPQKWISSIISTLSLVQSFQINLPTE